MRVTPAGPFNAHSKPGRVDFSNFIALPGETLAPLLRRVPVAISEDESAQLWRHITADTAASLPAPKPFPKDIWLFLAVRFLSVRDLVALGRTCKTLEQLLLSSEVVWRDLFVQSFGPPEEDRERFASWKGLYRHRATTGNICFYETPKGAHDFNPFAQTTLSARCVIVCRHEDCRRRRKRF